MFQIDDLIIERVAQPVADLLGRVTGRSCYWWAAQLFVGAVAGGLGCVCFFAVARPNPMWILSAVAGMVVVWFYAQMYFPLMKFDGAFGVIPWWRLHHQHLRIIALVTALTLSAPAVVIAMDIWWWAVLNFATNVLSVIGLYLAACVATRPPPRLARNLVPHWS